MPGAARKQAPPVDKRVATREKLRFSLLNWFDSEGRDLPWRVRGGPGDPYRVWLSEVMLQQTTVAAVIPYYETFLARWPNAAALAAAPREAVLAAWAGLGYYSRARNLHAAAEIVAAAGAFPQDEPGWRALPGVGAYTAAAIAAIVLGQPANVVDGNVARVMARLYAVETPLPAAAAELTRLAAALVTPERPGDWAQALMDLGATVCTPKSPACAACPLAWACRAKASGAPKRYPRRAAKAAKPVRHGAVFVLRRGAEIWQVRRPEPGLLAGMAGLPTTEWRGDAWSRAAALKFAPAPGPWRELGQATHVFTHFTLKLDIYESQSQPGGVGWWGAPEGLPSVFKKALKAPRRVQPQKR